MEFIKKIIQYTFGISTGLCVALFFCVYSVNAEIIYIDGFEEGLGDYSAFPQAYKYVQSTLNPKTGVYSAYGDKETSNIIRGIKRDINLNSNVWTIQIDIWRGLSGFADSPVNIGTTNQAEDTFCTIQVPAITDENYYNYKISSRGNGIIELYKDNTFISSSTVANCSLTLDHIVIYQQNSRQLVHLDNLTVYDNIPFNYEQDFDQAEVIEIPDWQGNIQIGSEVNLQYNKKNFCFLNQNIDCYLKFNYGYDVIDKELFLFEIDQSGQETFIASTTLDDKYLLQERFLIDEPESETDKQYCAVIVGGEEEEYYCDIVLSWVDNTYCNPGLICADVATSSDFLFGVQCGFRQGTCWLFTPTEASIDFFSKSVDNFTNSFPFNLVFGLIDEIDNAIASSSSGGSFGLPMYDKNTDNYYIMNGLDQFSYNEVLGSSTMETLETRANYLIYLVMSLLISFIIYRFAIINK